MRPCLPEEGAIPRPMNPSSPRTATRVHDSRGGAFIVSTSTTRLETPSESSKKTDGIPNRRSPPATVLFFRPVSAFLVQQVPLRNLMRLIKSWNESERKKRPSD